MKTLTIPFTKDLLDFTAHFVARQIQPDMDGRAYVELEKLNTDELIEFIANHYENPEKHGEAIAEIAKQSIALWALPPFGYWQPLLARSLKYASDENADLTLQHFMLLLAYNDLFGITAYIVGQFKGQFTPEQCAIEVLEAAQDNYTGVYSADIYCILETMENLGLLEFDGTYYQGYHVEVPQEQLEESFISLESYFTDMGCSIASTILKPFLPIK